MSSGDWSVGGTRKEFIGADKYAEETDSKHPTNWSTGYNPPRKEFFELEDYLDSESGYPERPVDWLRSVIYKDFCSLDLISPTSNLLDVGCAHGYFTRILCAGFAQTMGVDLSDKRIDYAKQYETDTLRFVQADLTADDFLAHFDIKFDVLYTSAVIQHVPLSGKISLFNNLASVSNEGAILVMYDEMIPSGVIDGYVGRYGVDWLYENITSWDCVGYDPLDTTDSVGKTMHRILMRRVGK
jgi:SAM-dependent methyltransferase